MKEYTFQIQGKSGFVFGVISAFTAHDAMEKLAKSKGFKSFKDMCEQTNSSENYELKNNFRIIW